MLFTLERTCSNLALSILPPPLPSPPFPSPSLYSQNVCFKCVKILWNSKNVKTLGLEWRRCPVCKTAIDAVALRSKDYVRYVFLWF